ncbi:helix-turn-helix domain-containing protein [Rhizobium leguminosarum bv. viciae]|nr:helix-turn-helix domain-containing protein [Rhizobium leguminosarum bv. viciae]
MITLHPAIARAARAYTGLDQKELGKSANVSSRTVFKLEKDGKVTEESLEKILAVFKTCGVVIRHDYRGIANGLEFTKLPARGSRWGL